MKYEQRVYDAVAELERLDNITRPDLIEIADRYHAPFKTVVEEAERRRLIWQGTYCDIMLRFRTVRAFREAAKAHRAKTAPPQGDTADGIN